MARDFIRELFGTSGNDDLDRIVPLSTNPAVTSNIPTNTFQSFDPFQTSAQFPESLNIGGTALGGSGLRQYQGGVAPAGYRRVGRSPNFAPIGAGGLPGGPPVPVPIPAPGVPGPGQGGSPIIPPDASATAQAAMLLGGAVQGNQFITQAGRESLLAGQIPGLGTIQNQFFRNTDVNIAESLRGLYSSVGTNRAALDQFFQLTRPTTFR